MIAYLKGTIIQKTAQTIILERAGVGYKIFVTPAVLEHSLGGTVELYTYHKVAEDEQTLFGVPDFKTLQFFELLITVTGVGPKMALTIISAACITVLETAIAHQDSDIFTRMSGVGRKTAERIILELKTKIGTITEAPTRGTSDTFDALIGLGFKSGEVREVLSKVDTSAPAEEQLKQALKLLGRS